jgi:hypothetical protein
MSRLPLIALVSLVAVLVGATPVLADSELGHTGKVGPHRLRDTASKPGVTCYYDASTELLTSLFIRAPMVRARDVSTSRDRQKVGWRYVIKRLEGPESVERFYRSPIMAARAYDDQAAPFQGVHHTLTIADDSASYYVTVNMLWYRGGSVEGRAFHEFDHYQATIQGSGTTQSLPGRGQCPSGYEV